jgi:hypothetical protein
VPRSTGTGNAPLDERTRRAVAAAIADEDALLSAYDEAAAALPALAGRLAGLRADHAEHRRVLATALGTTLDTRSPATGSGPSASSSGARGTAPRATLHRLLVAERTAAAARAASCLTAPPALAALLGSVAASEAAHDVVLRAAGLAPASGNASTP